MGATVVMYSHIVQHCHSTEGDMCNWVSPVQCMPMHLSWHFCHGSNILDGYSYWTLLHELSSGYMVTPVGEILLPLAMVGGEGWDGLHPSLGGQSTHPCATPSPFIHS